MLMIGYANEYLNVSVSIHPLNLVIQNEYRYFTSY